MLTNRPLNLRQPPQPPKIPVPPPPSQPEITQAPAIPLPQPPKIPVPPPPPQPEITQAPAIPPPPPLPIDIFSPATASSPVTKKFFNISDLASNQIPNQIRRQMPQVSYENPLKFLPPHANPFSNGRENLLKSIKIGNFKLKAVAKKENTKGVETNAENSLFKAIQSRRAFISRITNFQFKK